MNAAPKLPLSPANERVAAEKAADRKRSKQRQAFLLAEAQDHLERTFRPDLVKPTAETQDNLRKRPDPIEYLERTQVITPAQSEAAEEIGRIFVSLQGALLQRAADYRQRQAKGPGGVTERFARLHQDRYLPWAEYLGGAAALAPLDDHPGRPAIPGRCPIALQMSIVAIIDGVSLRELEDAFAIKHGKAAEILKYSLAVYCDLAGTEDGRPVIVAFERGMPRRWRKRL